MQQLKVRRHSAVLMALSALAVGCVAESNDRTDSPPLPETAVTATAPTDREAVTPEPTSLTGGSSPTPAPGRTPSSIGTPALPHVPLTPSGDQPGPIPGDLLERMIQDLADRLGLAPSAISVVSAESVVWNDGSLGCPEKGQMYLQVLTPGYRVLLEAQGRDYDYRGNTQGYFRICSPSLGSAAAPLLENIADHDRASQPIFLGAPVYGSDLPQR